MNKSQLQNENQPLISESEKHPRVFVWKTGALILSALIVVMAIIDISMLLYLNDHPVPPNNYTFANDIVFDSDIITQSSMIRNLMGNLARANPGFSFEFAQILAKGNGSQLTSETIKEKIFRVQDHNLLFLFKAQSATATHIFGLYSTASFPVPDADDFNKTELYYTFQFGDSRKSMLFSLENTDFVKANSTNKQIEKNPKLCRSYTLNETANSFSFMDVLGVTLDQSSSLVARNWSTIYQCFDKFSGEEQFATKMTSLTGFNFTTDTVSIDSFEVYYLKE